MKQFGLEVWGKYACFTRPELKVERYSYPVITPSAARAIFDSIYIRFDGQNDGKPSFRWQVRRIEILNPIQYVPLSRNEVKGKVSVEQVKQGMTSDSEIEPLFADGSGESSRESGRTQRQTIGLRNVRYRLFAEPILFEKNPVLRSQIEGIFQRRARTGQCNQQPYFGCREFTCYFEPIEAWGDACTTINETIDWMLYDVFDLSRPGSNMDTTSISTFRAEIVNGILEVPPYTSDAVRKLGMVML
jgi:CRISPR-associated protein Cas5d